MTDPDTQDVLQAVCDHMRAALRFIDELERLEGRGGGAGDRHLSVVGRRLPAPRRIVIVFATAYRAWCKAYGCACQWRLAAEVHPVYGNTAAWSAAIGVSITWQLLDYAWKGPAATRPPHLRPLPGSRAA